MSSVSEIVDSRIATAFADRDAMLMEMNESLKQVAQLIQQRTVALKVRDRQQREGGERERRRMRLSQTPGRTHAHLQTQMQTKMRTPLQHRLTRPRKGFSTPRVALSSKDVDEETLAARREFHSAHGARLKVQRTRRRPQLGYESKTYRPRRRGAARDENQDQVSQEESSLPRVATRKFAAAEGYVSPSARQKTVSQTYRAHGRLAEARQSSAVTYRNARSTVFAPERAAQHLSAPEEGLAPSGFWYGRLPGWRRSSGAVDLHRLTLGIVFAVAGIVVIFDESRMTQRFFVGHDGPVSCVAAAGQAAV